MNERIIAHRGYWEHKNQQNTWDGCLLGLLFCGGIEIDLRFDDEKIVLSHDPIRNLEKNKLACLEDLLTLHSFFPEKIWALNIKEDGLSDHLLRSLKPYPYLKYFCFDLSVPEMKIYHQKNLAYAVRVSDIEKPTDYFISQATAVVIDGFSQLPHKDQVLQSIKKMQPSALKMVISPELHHRPIDPLEITPWLQDTSFFLCTDNVHLN